MRRHMMHGLIPVAVLGLTAMPAMAQGLMSGTGLQPSQQVATPPKTPPIDRPGVQTSSAPPAVHRREAARKPADPNTAYRTPH
ncbi:hypothetical protein NFI95_06000 [Acetobacteraceae bacterium KSS8]|uniref:Uncharacterized protein n=1 Tax=Endosaccharibacter trunci TaxID=2812733 RepID=A0ABT1W6T3_9PROT|nr:hypothetical protein [Acetobacteraceae bacterium KSS8]